VPLEGSRRGAAVSFSKVSDQWSRASGIEPEQDGSIGSFAPSFCVGRFGRQSCKTLSARGGHDEGVRKRSAGCELGLLALATG